MRRNRPCWCVTVASVLALFFSSGLSQAQDTDSVSRNKLVLPELIQAVLARNPELVAARKQWEAATQRIVQARSLEDPTLSVEFFNTPKTFNVTQTENTIFGLSQSFPFPGKLALKGDVASRSAEITEQSLRAKERELIARLKQAYYDLFFTDKAVQIHHEQIALLKQFFEIANAKFRAGKGAQVDVLKAQVELSVLHEKLPVLEQHRQTAQAMLNTLLDRDPRFPLASPQPPRETRFDQDLEDLYQTATTARPEIKAAELDVQRRQQSRALAQRQYYPDFNVSFRRFKNFQADDGFGAYVSMSIPFAFWTKPKYDAAVQEAEAASAAARADLHTLENMTRFQIRDLLAKARASWEVAVLYRTTVLPQAEQGVEAARIGYQVGKSNFLDLLDADRAWRGFQLEYYRALVEREFRLAELEQVIGIDLKGNS